jgi:hypothetical protein
MVWACLKHSDALLNAVKTRESLLAVFFDVVMEHFELGGDVFDGGGEPDHCVTRFIVALAEAHRAHRSHADGSPSNSSDQLNHALMLNPLLVLLAANNTVSSDTGCGA